MAREAETFSFSSFTLFTDNEFHGKSLFIPVPVPVYIPVPMAMYSVPVPYPLATPVPVPLPCFLPTTKKSTESIFKHIKVCFKVFRSQRLRENY